jgi:hypothetical protein
MMKEDRTRSQRCKRVNSDVESQQVTSLTDDDEAKVKEREG